MTILCSYIFPQRLCFADQQRVGIEIKEGDDISILWYGKSNNFCRLYIHTWETEKSSNYLSWKEERTDCNYISLLAAVTMLCSFTAVHKAYLDIKALKYLEKLVNMVGKPRS